MRTWTLSAVAAALGVAAGWSLRGSPKPEIRVVERPVRVEVPRVAERRPVLFPDYPKPRFELPPPQASMGGGSGMPPIIVGDLPSLPTASLGGPMSTMEPSVPSVMPAADLNADEALARRIVLQSGGEVVSSADAKDASGKVGRALVAEAPPAAGSGLRDALRKALGDRLVLSDGGAVEGSAPELAKAERDLAAARKQRDQARLDFLPEAPALKQIEDDYDRQEKALADRRKALARVRLNILLRPVLAS